MKLALILVGLLTATGLAPRVCAQTPGESRPVGQMIGGTLTLDAVKGTEEDTVTLTFITRNDPRFYTIDFIVRHQIRQPVSQPGVIDMIVTQRATEDEAPAMALTVDGDAQPLVAREHSRRSIVASMSLSDFDRITSAENVVERAFGVALEFTPGQLKMLRHTADRWLGRVR